MVNMCQKMVTNYHANNNLLTVNLYFDGVGKARHTATIGR